MEKITKIIFKIALFIAVLFYQNAGELIIVATILYFPLVYAAAYFDKLLNVVEVGTGVATGRRIGLVRIKGILTPCYL